MGTIRDFTPASMAEPGHPLRTGGPPALALELGQLRERLRSLWQAYVRALPASLDIRYAVELNPPLWELGHIGWFEDFWIGRNPQRLDGVAADADTPRAASWFSKAEAWYHSSHVGHTARWHLDLPDARRTWQYLDRVRDTSLRLLDRTPADDQGLYFHRLAAHHEAMHIEAWVYMAQNLAIDLRDTPQALDAGAVGTDGQLDFAEQAFILGSDGPGFVFDNERCGHRVEAAAFTIDTRAVTWERYLPFAEAGGYDNPALWTAEGWAWRQRHNPGRPRVLQREDGVWRRALFGRWEAIDPQAPAVHLSAHEARAWCRWAGRRLPTEAEWECAAMAGGPEFHWGQVWEWTASAFAPYPGFETHPYRDYSQPWFDGRPVLRGASFATWPAFRNPRYRNYFTPERNDIFAGFRSCAGPQP